MAATSLNRADIKVAATPPLSAATVDRIDRAGRRASLGETKPLAWRRGQLAALDMMLDEQQSAWIAALNEDLGKGETEALSTEIAFVRAEIAHSLRHLERWTSPEKVSTPWQLRPGRSAIVREPLGLVLIIGAWNLPLAVLLGPAVAAIAAGNAVVLKPSELAPATSTLLQRLTSYLNPEAVVVIEGGVAQTTALLERRWDHIFFTGSARVARFVADAAAKHLTPVTLELGGKSPAYVHESADLTVTARRIAWAKWMNAGQVCVSPDYVLADRSIASDLVEAIGRALEEFYGEDPRQSDDYGRIVNAQHHDRLTALLSSHGGEMVRGGRHDRAALYFEPTLIIEPLASAPLMREEIFGPILPIVLVDNDEEAIRRIHAGPKPLTLYVFARDPDVTDRFVQRTSSGALVANDAIVNHRIPELPFSGVGDSGHGAYHGKAGFESFSHRKAVFRKSTRFDLALRYPPYTAKKLAALRWLMGM